MRWQLSSLAANASAPVRTRPFVGRERHPHRLARAHTVTRPQRPRPQARPRTRRCRARRHHQQQPSPPYLDRTLCWTTRWVVLRTGPRLRRGPRPRQRGQQWFRARARSCRPAFRYRAASTRRSSGVSFVLILSSSRIATSRRWRSSQRWRDAFWFSSRSRRRGRSSRRLCRILRWATPRSRLASPKPSGNGSSRGLSAAVSSSSRTRSCCRHLAAGNNERTLLQVRLGP